MITTSLEREYVTRILLFEVNSVLKSLITAFTLKKILYSYQKEIKENTPGSTNHYYFDDICRYLIKTWESWANFEKLSSLTTDERKEFECKNKLIDGKQVFAFQKDDQ